MYKIISAKLKVFYSDDKQYYQYGVPRLARSDCLVTRGGGLGSDLVLLSMQGDELLLLGGNTLLAALAGLTHLLSASLGLISQHLAALLLSLLLVDVLHEDALVLEHVTLALHVQVVVQVPVNLLAVAVLLQQAAQNALALHPQQLGRHAGVRSTLTLSESAVTSLAAGLGVFAHTVTGVDHDGLLDDQTILDKLANVLTWNGLTTQLAGLSIRPFRPFLLTRVCVSDLVDFIGIQPDLLLAASQHGGCEPLLEL